MAHPFQSKFVAAALGIASVVLFCFAFTIFGSLNSGFDFLRDHISKLGAQGQPNALSWNLIGFGLVGFLLTAFGGCLGLTLNDWILGACLVVAGIGYAMGCVPTDFTDEQSTSSKIHFVSICFSLAGWCGGLARMMQLPAAFPGLQTTAKYAVASSLLPIVLAGAEVITEPMTHRILIAIILGWVSITSVQIASVNVTDRTKTTPKQDSKPQRLEAP